MLIKKIVISAFLLSNANAIYAMHKLSVSVCARPLGLMQIQPGSYDSCHPKATFHGKSLLLLIIEANKRIQKNTPRIDPSHFNTFIHEAKQELLQLVNKKLETIQLPYSYTTNSLYPYIWLVSFPYQRPCFADTIRVEPVLIQDKIALLNTGPQRENKKYRSVFVELEDFSRQKEISGISMAECYKKVVEILQNHRAAL